ncbi:NAD(P)/FAD-dependent oxidoreductase [Clostridium magnum]|uniref:NAD(P)/FAD-dependent oxidoreductase n=1 Tax=Clostridium magnum TaxID=33954 RepID=UPI003BFA6D25
MNVLNNRIIIIGGGIAGISAIKAIREVDSEIEIHMISNEKFYPYNRLRLTKGLFGNLSEEAILLQKREWYEANSVKLYINKEVTRIDVEEHEVILDDDSRLKFSKLLLASGAHNFTPPIEGIDKQNVYTIRHLEDAWVVKDIVLEKKKPLTIGGGIQGLETAWELNQHGAEVAIAEIQSRLMPMQLDIKASQILHSIIESYNIKVYLETQVHKILGENSVTGVSREDGLQISCDMVVYNAGVRPNIKYIKDTPINFNKGVIVNNKMETSVQDIYAAGDVAEFKSRISGLWNIAIEQGKLAGYNMIGMDKVYKDIVPVTTLNAFGISLFSMGNVDEGKCDYSLIEESSENKVYKRIFIHENKIAGAIVIGDTKKSPILKSAIENQILVDEFDLSKIFIESEIITRKE